MKMTKRIGGSRILFRSDPDQTMVICLHLGGTPTTYLGREEGGTSGFVVVLCYLHSEATSPATLGCLSERETCGKFHMRVRRL